MERNISGEKIMKRVYDQGENIEDIQYFVGTEVEHTPQYGKKTLFVVGIQNYSDIVHSAEMHGCKHVYLGANMSWSKDESWDEIYQVKKS
jgi:hypothetical protein